MPPKSSMVGPQLSILCFLSSAIKTILKVYMYVSMKKKCGANWSMYVVIS